VGWNAEAVLTNIQSNKASHRPRLPDPPSSSLEVGAGPRLAWANARGRQRSTGRPITLGRRAGGPGRGGVEDAPQAHLHVREQTPGGVNEALGRPTGDLLGE
jgi:hypothetical protein